MDPERFADVVERFTNGFPGAVVTVTGGMDLFTF